MLKESQLPSSSVPSVAPMIVELYTFLSEEPATEIAILLLAFGHEEVANRIITVVLFHVLCEQDSPILFQSPEYSKRSIPIGTVWW